MNRCWECIGDTAQGGTALAIIVIAVVGIILFYEWLSHKNICWPHWLKIVGKVVGITLLVGFGLAWAIPICYALYRGAVCVFCPECGL